MKKLLALTLALLMVFSLVACGGGDKAGKKDDTPSGDKSSFAFGKVSGTTYENEFIGVGCTLPSDWLFYSEEEIIEANNLVVDSLDGDIKDIIESATVLYDMFAQSPTGQNNVNVVLEKVPQIKLDTLNIKQNFELLLPTLKATYEQIGFTDINASVVNKTIGGKELPTAVMTANAAGQQVKMYQFAVKCDGFLASITVTAFSGDADALLNTFYFL